MGIGPQNLGASGGKEGHTPCGHKKQISPFNKMVGGEEKKEKNSEVEGQETVTTNTPEQPTEEQPTEEQPTQEQPQVVEEPSAVSKAYANQQHTDTSQPIQAGPPIPPPLSSGFNKGSDEELAKIRKKPGMSNAGRYNVATYAGPNKSYPINTIDRGRAALRLAWKAGPKLEKQIKENVYKKYSSLRPDNNSQNA